MILHPWATELVGEMARAFAASGVPTIPPGRRDDLFRMLMSAVLGPVARDEYLALLTAALGSTPPATAVVPADRLIGEGAGFLSDAELAAWALDPRTIRELTAALIVATANGRLGECWADAFGDICEPSSGPSPEATARNRARLRALISGSAADFLAACGIQPEEDPPQTS